MVKVVAKLQHVDNAVMASYQPKIRLYVNAPLAAGTSVPLPSEAMHYLAHVMRQRSGDAILLFNGRDGEWRADITELGKKAGEARCQAQTRPQMQPKDLWLLFAPVKRARIDFIAEKAAELGAAALQPVITERTDVTRVNVGRLAAHAKEAAEQTHALWVPEVRPPVSLPHALSSLGARKLIFCDETGGQPIAEALNGETGQGPWALLVGPEGGFSEKERDLLAVQAPCFRVSLGPRILRADTAAVAGLSLWQALLGDWTAAN